MAEENVWPKEME